MRKIFIDCGAHCGESILEAKRRFGDDLEVYSFEANTNLANALQEYFKNDPKVTVENKAVWIDDSQLDLYLSVGWSDGSSVYKEKNSGGISDNIKLTVPCFDLSSFIKNTFKEEDYIILKLDIEGAEYEVIESLGVHGVFDRVILMFTEFHDSKIPGQWRKSLKLSLWNCRKWGIRRGQLVEWL